MLSIQLQRSRTCYRGPLTTNRKGVNELRNQYRRSSIVRAVDLRDRRQRLVAQGYIPAMRTPRLWLVSRRVLERLLEQGEFAVTLRDQQAMGE